MAKEQIEKSSSIWKLYDEFSEAKDSEYYKSKLEDSEDKMRGFTTSELDAMKKVVFNEVDFSNLHYLSGERRKYQFLRFILNLLKDTFSYQKDYLDTKRLIDDPDVVIRKDKIKGMLDKLSISELYQLLFEIDDYDNRGIIRISEKIKEKENKKDNDQEDIKERLLSELDTNQGKAMKIMCELLLEQQKTIKEQEKAIRKMEADNHERHQRLEEKLKEIYEYLVLKLSYI